MPEKMVGQWMGREGPPSRGGVVDTKGANIAQDILHWYETSALQPDETPWKNSQQEAAGNQHTDKYNAKAATSLSITWRGTGFLGLGSLCLARLFLIEQVLENVSTSRVPACSYQKKA